MGVCGNYTAVIDWAILTYVVYAINNNVYIYMLYLLCGHMQPGQLLVNKISVATMHANVCGLRELQNVVK